MATLKNRSKLSLLLGLLRKNRGEASDRLLTLAEFQADRLRRKASMPPVNPAECRRRLGEALRGDLEPFLREASLLEIERQVTDARQALTADPAFAMVHAADMSLARLCYAVCRLRKPAVVVETGVAHGASSAFLLKALSVNGPGELWSIDLPPLAEGADDQVGRLVPADLRGRWHLLRGRSRRLLPGLVRDLPAIDVFLHDSLHTHRNISFEFRTVWPRLSPGGVLISDDVDLNRAFENFARRPDVSFAIACGQENKSAVFGVVVKSR